MNLEDIFATAHIHLETATLRVYVNDVKKYEKLFFPRCKQIDEDIYEEDSEWKKELNFPEFVISVSRGNIENTLSIWVTEDFDLIELNNWLKTFK